MKAKYKLGTLVRFERGGNDGHGVVDGIITRASGFQYILDAGEANDAVTEEEITNAYRPVVAKEKKAKANGSGKKKSKSTESQVAA